MQSSEKSITLFYIYCNAFSGAAVKYVITSDNNGYLVFHEDDGSELNEREINWHNNIIPPNAKMVDNWLYINAVTEIKKYCETTIDPYKFKNDQVLKSISFVNDKVLIISSEAFIGCSNLVNVDLPKKMIFICKRAFMNCTSIEQMNRLPSRLLLN